MGSPTVQQLAATKETIVAATDGIKVSADDGKTFVDASERVGQSRWGSPEPIYELVVVGDELLAVSEKALYRSAEHGRRWYRCADPPPHPDPKRVISERRRAGYGAGVAYMSAGSRLFTSTDAGKTWHAAPADLPSSLPDGLVATERGLYAWSGGNIGALARSRDGEPFESLQRLLGPKRKIPHARHLFDDGAVIHVVGGDDVTAWNPKTDQMTSLAKKVPRDQAQREWIHSAAVHGKTILVQVRSDRRVRLYLSLDRGASYHEVDGPEGYAIEALAPSEAGILAAARGLWLLPVQ